MGIACGNMLSTGIRVAITVLFLTANIIVAYREVYTMVHSMAPVWSQDQGFNIFWTFLKYTNEVLIFLHTILTCIDGLDWWYLLTLTLWYFPNLFIVITQMKTLFSASVPPSLSIFTWIFFMVTYFARVVIYYIWNIPTRVFFVQIYRKIIQRYNADFSIIMRLLTRPIGFLFAFRILLFAGRFIPLVKTTRTGGKNLAGKRHRVLDIGHLTIYH